MEQNEGGRPNVRRLLIHTLAVVAFVVVLWLAPVNNNVRLIIYICLFLGEALITVFMRGYWASDEDQQ
jgi:hypothetical protein